MFKIDVCDFNKDTPESLKNVRHWEQDVGSNWPVVYIINNDKEAYVGETVSASRRMEQHYQNPERQRLTQLRIISDKSFNKSVILDLEAFLIKYMSSDGRFELQNGNNGIQNHEYFNKQEYEDAFSQLWNKLLKENLAKNTLIDIENSELYKYSPYKSLGPEQIEVEQVILEHLLQFANTENGMSAVIYGGAGTGKTILAIYMMKLLSDGIGQIGGQMPDRARREYYLEENDNAVEAIYAEECMDGLKKIGIVVPQKSLQSSLKDVFSRVKGLNKAMVLSPKELVDNYVKTGEKYDLLFVDEAHRLKCRYQGHLSFYGSFDHCNELLGLDKTYGTELDWILKCSRNQVFFRDGLQSVRPCDIPTKDFEKAVNSGERVVFSRVLSHQWRCRGGNDYIDYIKNILACRQDKFEEIENYELILFENCDEMIQAIKEKDKEFGLCRVAAGFAWPWNANKKENKNKVVNDVKIQGKEYHWNASYDNWISSPNAVNEIACIHTVQGYDLNYAGIIIGEDIKYDPVKNCIYPDKECYFDQQGKSGVSNKPDELLEYLTNIYLTLMTRGIRGTYLYVCNDALREYFKKYIKQYS